jgi:hypothetical protein
MPVDLEITIYFSFNRFFCFQLLLHYFAEITTSFYPLWLAGNALMNNDVIKFHSEAIQFAKGGILETKVR